MGFQERSQNPLQRLTLIQALLSDAENWRLTLAIMCEWLKNIKRVTGDAENALDEFAYETLQRKLEVQNRMRNKVCNFFSLSNPLAFHLKMAHKVKDINSMLDLICKEPNDIGLKQTDQLLNAATTSVEPREVTFRVSQHFVDHSEVVGRDEGKCLALTSIATEANYHPEVQHLMVKTSFEIPKENVGKLRTLFLTGNLPKSIAEVECIRTMSLVDWYQKELPSSLRKLIHLRYLDDSRSYFRTLPNFLTMLYNLQSLRLSSFAFQNLPKKFYELVRLRHFYIDDDEHNRKLMPMMIGKLTSLQTLPFFVVGEDEGCKIEELGSLNKLRGKLMIYNLQQVKSREDTEKAKILGKPNICELGFHWDRVGNPSTAGDTTSINHEDMLEGLKPCGNLKVLKLKKFEGQNFASWMMSGRDAQLLQNLVKIELSKCTRCEQVPPLGHLPCHALKFNP
ncbi:hypothetical protein TEA_025931 [Camellia sinensis var. sinensis]|uniref:Uncharacterized protein n=1 Tax=Camellia sinensis var. sinensis TaxID=542762 RepID=A0A4S4D004_CAMSN|nr:hypothetical protein TEA_025931 [Camellia sinensis var. sinensis]